MIQKDFLIKNILDTGREISSLIRFLNSVPHKNALLTVYETGFPEFQIKALLNKIKSSTSGKLKIAGISVYAMADVPENGLGIRLNVLLFESSDAEVVTIPCKPGEEDKAVRIMRERLSHHPDAKAVELFVCNTGINTTRFIEESMKGHEEVGLFGTMSSRIMPDTMTRGFSVDIFDVFSKAEKMRTHNQYAISDRMLTDGFVAVIFYGEDLRVRLNYALGWHAVGREMPFVKGERGIIGETCLTEIGGFKSVDLYKEYLGVNPDDYFISNICEFPLMVRRNGIDICLIPFDYGEEGEVYFNISLREDEKLSFSYANHDEVLGEARKSCMDMADFAPEALFLVLCGNRINFLRDDAALEWEGFRQAATDFALIHGASELYYQYGRGGILNSAHIAVGMREGEKPEGVPEKKLMDMNCFHHHDVIPLSERMSVFMNKMTRELQEMAEEAEAANIAKSSFLSSMSHEIRTPINAILGMDEMILRESNEENIIKYGEDIMSAGNSLLGIVNDILDFSKIEAGKLNIIPVEYEFSSVINDVLNIIKKRAEDKGIKLILDIDPEIPSVLYGDEIRLKQIITNILTNAVKYTEEGSITLSAGLPEGKDAHPSDYIECHGAACFKNPVKLKIAVADTGIGIKSEDMERLFSAFERVDEKRNRTIEGTGLGLAITESLLELMDSRLTVESEYGKGSVFSFEVVQGISRNEPVGDISKRWSSVNQSHKKYRESFQAKDARILVVDDTAMNLDVIKNLLKKTLIRIDTALSGEEALELVKKNRYDCIFLDHRMPHMDGIECLKRMKEMDENLSKASPVISLTANAVSGAREEYLTAGFSDYLTKPIVSAKLEEMLIRYLPPEKVVMTGAAEEKNGAAGDIPEWVKNVPGLDPEKGVENAGSAEDYLSILSSFQSTVNEKADEIERYYREEDWKDYTVKVHALKSSSRIVGIDKLSEMARLLEEAGDKGDTDLIKNKTDELLTCYRSYDGLLSPVKGPSSGEGDSLPEASADLIQDALRSLKEFADAEDYELSRMVLDSMREYSLPDDERERFEGMRSRLSNLDWDGIREIITKKDIG